MSKIAPFLAATLAASLVALPALSQAASTKAIYDCAAISDDAARLTCYDTAVGNLKSAEEAGEITTVSRSDVEKVQRESFGFSIPSLPKLALPKLGGSKDKVDDNGQLASVNFAVSNVRRDPYKKVVVTLENGQIWRQTDSNTVTFSKRRGVKEATIKRAAMGSFKIKLDGGPAFRAKRIK